MRAVTVRLPGLSLILATRELPYERRPPRESPALGILQACCWHPKMGISDAIQEKGVPHDPLLGEPH